MLISELITALEQVRSEHGDIDVGFYEYAGGNDELREVRSVRAESESELIAPTCVLRTY